MVTISMVHIGITELLHSNFYLEEKMRASNRSMSGSLYNAFRNSSAEGRLTP